MAIVKRYGDDAIWRRPPVLTNYKRMEIAGVADYAVRQYIAPVLDPRTTARSEAPPAGVFAQLPVTKGEARTRKYGAAIANPMTTTTISPVRAAIVRNMDMLPLPRMMGIRWHSPISAKVRQLTLLLVTF